MSERLTVNRARRFARSNETSRGGPLVGLRTKCYDQRLGLELDERLSLVLEGGLERAGVEIDFHGLSGSEVAKQADTDGEEAVGGHL